MIATLLVMMLTGAAPAIRADSLLLDSFDSVSEWSAIPADGVELMVHADSGRHGQGMRLDFDFHGHGGYAVVHRKLNLELPANYEFSFAVRGDAPPNTLEFKLIDSTGENVWWSNNPNFIFPREWRTIARKKRQISFAWGPIGGGDIHRVASIEFAITAGSGGKGSIWLDDLVLTRLDPDAPYDLTPRVTASPQAYDLDFLKRREFSGLIIDWEPKHRAQSYDVLGSTDGKTWQQLYSVNRKDTPPGATPRDFLYLPESDARYLRVALKSGGGSSGYAIRNLSVKPRDWAPSENDFFFAVASAAPRGSYPRYFSREQSYWTVVGADRDTAEGLINEEGMIETGRGQFSIEPFLSADGKLITWNDAKIAVIPDSEALPLPEVTWTAGDLGLTVTAFAAEHPDPSILFARYRVSNNSSRRRNAKLYLALRPFQVNPPWQFLNLAGGVARVDSVSLDRGLARVNGNLFVRSLSPPNASGAATLDEGNIVDWLRSGTVPTASSVVDAAGHASAVFGYDLDLAPHSSSAWIEVAVPLHGGDVSAGAQSPSAQLVKTRAAWREKLGRVTIQLPPSAARYTETMRANLAYILINRDGPAIQPGSRSYSRSWIRDGALTATALLRLGHAAEVRDFIEWYAPYQYANGKIPCCVDEHGATPVPENDSHGEFIYLIAEYFRHTGDRALLEQMWPRVALAVSYMDSLRRSRMTEEYQAPDKHAYYGLLPQSISHEGYSAKPMHSYWDDLFALRGYKDAAFIATELRRPEAAAMAASRDEFRANLYASMRLAMQQHHIDVIPGSVELGDFDPTSTTIAVSPVGELGRLPEPALTHTFDRYFEEFRARRDGRIAAEVYTPYELRAVGTMVQLGHRDRAHEMLAFFFNDQRPPAWHMWSEAVWKDPRTPAFIGDMPHTWVGSDYIRSFLDMFAYERESDSSLVIGAGIEEEWLRQSPGVRVAGLSTQYGPLSYEMNAIGNAVTVTLHRGPRLPPGGIVVRPPAETAMISATVEGIAAAIRDAEVRVRQLPATVVIRYAK
jgi:F5/8 type C domain